MVGENSYGLILSSAKGRVKDRGRPRPSRRPQERAPQDEVGVNDASIRQDVVAFSPTKHSGNTIVPRAIERAATSLRHTGRDTTMASRQLDWRNDNASQDYPRIDRRSFLGVAALAPGSASAHGF